ncbi:MAG TPA: hypothetical protein VHW45_00370 [Candidatus Sulfotelmatobacter sp.]|jgi:hypothetical protein|nr:hypothetical protein [Candidatus Sulfotelmatobacter sp.]
MRKRILFIATSVLLLTCGYIVGTRKTIFAYDPTHGNVPKSYGKLSAVIADSIGTGLVFEDKDGVIRFVSANGMKEGELARYDDKPTQGGIPKSYGHLAGAVVNHGQTALIFEDAQGVIRCLTLTGTVENELTRN